MTPEPITDIHDPRVAPYHRMRDRELAREGDRFLLEGDKLILRAIEAGTKLHSVLTLETRIDRLLETLDKYAPQTPVFTLTHEQLKPLTGMRYTNGVYAIAQRPTLPDFPTWLTALFTHEAKHTTAPLTLIALPRVTIPSNLGSIIRIAAALNVAGLILGEQSTDPFYRRATRVSMGTVFNLPIYQSTHILNDLNILRDQHQFTTYATLLDEHATSLYDYHQTRPVRQILVMGNEHDGLSTEDLTVCDHKLYLPMGHNTDSLNVAMATAVFLYELTRPR